MLDATLIFPLVSAVIAVLGMPLWVGMVPPNRFYGVRVAATLADEAVWYAVNKAAGRDMVAVGAVMLVLSTSLLKSDIGGVAYAVLMSAVLVAGAAFILGVGMARTRRLR
jgi:uncharacterized membrane protein